MKKYGYETETDPRNKRAKAAVTRSQIGITYRQGHKKRQKRNRESSNEGNNQADIKRDRSKEQQGQGRL